MAQALRLARKAEGKTAPNPPVGAVVVREGRVVGKGYHRMAGAPHAEVAALDQAGEKARGADLYVTLEPCNHFGKTPPCTEKILAFGIKRVFIGALDPNRGVAGGGAKRLMGNGVEVESGILKDRCQDLIAPFTSLITLGRPYVSLKIAASLDGRLAVRSGQSQWLTGPQALAWTHRLRDRSEAIMVGRSTVTVDDPSLTARLKSGKGRNPLRVILDSKLSTDPKAKAVTGPIGDRPERGGPAGSGCLILTCTDAPLAKRLALEKAGAEVVALGSGHGGVDLKEALEILGQRKVMSLLLEGGPELAGHFFRAGFVDQVFFLYAPLVIGGAAAPGMVAGPLIKEIAQAARLGDLKTRRLGRDILIRAKVIKESS